MYNNLQYLSKFCEFVLELEWIKDFQENQPRSDVH